MRHFFFCFVLAQLGLPSLASEGGGGLEGFRRDGRELLPMGRMMGSKVYCFEAYFAGRQMYFYTTRQDMCMLSYQAIVVPSFMLETG
jgi:hypothetical protein